MIISDISHNLTNTSVNLFKSNRTMNKVKINWKNWISGQGINKANWKSQNKTASRTNKRTITSSQKKPNSNKHYKEHNLKLINWLSKGISISKSMTSTEIKCNPMLTSTPMEIINKKKLKSWKARSLTWKRKEDQMKKLKSILNCKGCMMLCWRKIIV